MLWSFKHLKLVEAIRLDFVLIRQHGWSMYTKSLTRYFPFIRRHPSLVSLMSVKRLVYKAPSISVHRNKTLKKLPHRRHRNATMTQFQLIKLPKLTIQKAMKSIQSFQPTWLMVRKTVDDHRFSVKSLVLPWKKLKMDSH